MTSASERLWRSAQQTSWSHRPSEADVQAIAAAVGSDEAIDGVWRVAWSLTSSSALAVTSRALLIGDQLQSRSFRALLESAPPDFRFGSRALVIPRRRITGVQFSAAQIVVRTDLGPVHLRAPQGASRCREMEEALLRLGEHPAPGTSFVPSGSASSTASGEQGAAPRARSNGRATALWEGRSLVDGHVVIVRRSSSPTSTFRRWVTPAGRGWRRMPRGAQWTTGIGAFVAIQHVAAPAGVLFVVLLLAFLAVTNPGVAGRERTMAEPEAALASSGTIEAHVAGAACRAWEETLREPSWSAPALAATRATFDGDREVDGIVDLALRIHAARTGLGNRPTGAAADIWQQQVDALDRAALRLGERADALIRHRDQAAELSGELAQLAELERLERSALIIDDLTIETSATLPQAGHGSVSDQLEAARHAVAELIDLMTRTRAPLLDPDPPSRPPDDDGRRGW